MDKNDTKNETDKKKQDKTEQTPIDQVPINQTPIDIDINKADTSNIRTNKVVGTHFF